MFSTTKMLLTDVLEFLTSAMDVFCKIGRIFKFLGEFSFWGVDGGPGKTYKINYFFNFAIKTNYFLFNFQ